MRDRTPHASRATTYSALLSAAAAFALPLLFYSSGYRYTVALGYSLGLTVISVTLTVYALARWRRRAIWTLFGLPLALFFPTIIGLALLACARGQACL